MQRVIFEAVWVLLVIGIFVAAMGCTSVPQQPRAILMIKEPMFIHCDWIDHDFSWRKEDLICYPNDMQEPDFLR